MTEQLTGYEASSVTEIEAILDDSPADANEVYLRTISYSERALAAVAAKRAGGTFNGGTITEPLVVASTDPNSPPILIQASWNAQNDDFFAIENTDADGTRFVAVNPSGDFVMTSKTGATEREYLPQQAATARFSTGIAGNPIVSGALPTVAFVSAAGQQISVLRNVHLVVPCTLNPTAGAAGTVKVELSPDNVTYSELVTLTEPAGIALDGTIMAASLQVPAGWHVKLTATNATIGTGTYY